MIDPKTDWVMIIGAGFFQLKAIREAKALGLRVLAIDRSADAPGAKEVDAFESISTRDIPAAIQAARRLASQWRLRGVFTAGTDVSYTVASVAKALGLPGIDPQAALCATNKYLMRLKLREGNVPVPFFHQATTLEEAEAAAFALGFPLVIKPVDNMGARGVRRIDSLEDLRNQFQDSFSKSGNYGTPAVILETFLEGDEISMDTLVCDGKVHLLTIADRHIGYPPYFVEHGHSIPSLLSQEKLENAFDVMCRAIKAIGITTGAAKADIKITKNGAWLGEITARLSGGFHSQFTEHLATGMNTTRAALCLAVGEPIFQEDIMPQWNRVAIEQALILSPGIIETIKGVEEAAQVPGIHRIFMHCQEGERINPVRDNLGKAGNILAFSADRSEAEAAIRKALKLIRIQMRPEIPVALECVPANCARVH